MFLTILEFAGVTLGVKFALGLALIYFLFPADGRCSACDGETVPLRAGRGLRTVGRVLRVERRWCLHCGETMMTRRAGSPPVQPGPVEQPQERNAA